MRLLMVVVTLSLFPPPGLADVLDDRKSCESIAGTWSYGGGPGRLGSCRLGQSYTIPAGERLEVAASVDLLLVNGTLTNRGELYIFNYGAIIVDGGYLVNDHYMAIRNNGLLKLVNGFISNVSVLENEGDISNNRRVPLNVTFAEGIYNSGNLISFDGGDIHNFGRFVNGGGGELTVGPGGRFFNADGSYYLVDNDHIHGQFFNQYGGYVDNERAMTVHAGGLFENSGTVELGGNNGFGLLRGESGSQINSSSGSLFLVTGGTLAGTIVVDGDMYLGGEMRLGGDLISHSGNITNANGAVFFVGTDGLVSSFNGSFLNESGGSIVNGGSMLFSCFASFSNSGSFRGTPIWKSKCFYPPISPLENVVIHPH